MRGDVKHQSRYKDSFVSDIFGAFPAKRGIFFSPSDTCQLRKQPMTVSSEAFTSSPPLLPPIILYDHETAFPSSHVHLGFAFDVSAYIICLDSTSDAVLVAANGSGNGAHRHAPRITAATAAHAWKGTPVQLTNTNRRSTSDPDSKQSPE